MIENRKIVRRWELLLFLPVTDTNAGTVMGRIADITREGVLVFTQHELPLDKIYSMEIQRAHLEEALLSKDVEQESLRFQAQVRWADENMGLYRIGMQFVDLDEATSTSVRTVVRNVAHNLG